VLVGLIIPESVSAQAWTGNGPYYKNVRAIAQSPANPLLMWAGAFGWGVFKSSDGGATWVDKRTGMANAYVRSLVALSDSTVFAGTNDGIFKSTNGGLTWSNSLNNLVSNYASKSVLESGISNCGLQTLIDSTLYSSAPPTWRFVLRSFDNSIFSTTSTKNIYNGANVSWRDYDTIFTPVEGSSSGFIFVGNLDYGPRLSPYTGHHTTFYDDTTIYTVQVNGLSITSVYSYPTIAWVPMTITEGIITHQVFRISGTKSQLNTLLHSVKFNGGNPDQIKVLQSTTYLTLASWPTNPQL